MPSSKTKTAAAKKSSGKMRAKKSPAKSKRASKSHSTAMLSNLW